MSCIRRFLVLLVALLLLGSACTAANTASSEATRPVASTTALQSVVEFDASLEFLDRVAERMAATPHRFETFITVDEASEAAGPGMVGESDGSWARAILAGPPSDSGGEFSIDEASAVVISDGADFYMSTPGANMFEGVTLDPISQAAAEGWVLLRLADIEARVGPDLTPTMNPPTFVTADDMWGGLRDALRISEGPRSNIRGVQTRSIVVEVEQLSGFAGNEIATVTIHVDAEGYVRSAVEEFGRTDFFDFGGVDIVVSPPVDALDMTEAWLDTLEMQQGASTVESQAAEVEEAPADLEESDTVLLPSEVGFPTVPESMLIQPELSVFLELLQASDSIDIFGNPNAQWTVLAPTNDALASIGDELDDIRNDPALRNRFVRRHIILGAFDVADLRNAGTVMSLENEAISVSSEGNALIFNDDVWVVVPASPSAGSFVYFIAKPL